MKYNRYKQKMRRHRFPVLYGFDMLLFYPSHFLQEKEK